MSYQIMNKWIERCENKDCPYREGCNCLDGNKSPKMELDYNDGQLCAYCRTEDGLGWAEKTEYTFNIE